MKSSEIRKAFLDYYSKRNHTIVPSSSLIPTNDPTLLFTNAGMVPFKDTFLGLESHAYTRATSVQRCVRAGGKHNDLENVGYTARHHTFFEMLGNFSFGDYFKREAIGYAWEFLTEVLKLPKERLWISIYQDDDEAASIWLDEIGISPERFSRCGDKDNFWSMGDTGPCGPCTEIFYDHGAHIPGGPPGSPDAEGDRYIEIWNLVFMQFNRDKNGELHPLPKPSVDTGMGLERIAAVVQGVHNNYDIDSFQHLIRAIEKRAKGVDHGHPSLKVIADHIRACSFLIADGVIPSNEGRGYVLRRIIRRAVRHGNKLGLTAPFFSSLVAPLVEEMGDAYPMLVTEQSHIERTLLQEENQFAHTLAQGLALLQEQIQGLESKEIAGDIAFKLYDTYGFPLDLTEDIAREQGLHIDIAGFEKCMQQQRLQSQSASQFQVDYATPVNLSEVSSFQGYEADVSTAKIQAILSGGEKINEAKSKTKMAIVLDDTPFYAESGGQVGDKGEITTDTALFRVEDTQKQGRAIVHYGELLRGSLHCGQTVSARIDVARRKATRLHHTATHLLHAALKEILGEHVQQKGSLVDAERARFDFSHREALTVTELRAIEAWVNERIRANAEVVTTVMPIEEAKKEGAVALFGEKYGDEVRVLSIGSESKELCGGTHAQRSGDIGLFKITAEYGVASGVRRIEMAAGEPALCFVNEQLALLDDLALSLKATPSSVSGKLAQWMRDAKEKEKELSQLKQTIIAQSGTALLSEAKKVGGVNLLVKRLENVSSEELRGLLDKLKSSLEDAVIVLISVSGDKMNVVAGVSKSVLGKVPTAADFVRHLCGKGGGRDDMAQGGSLVPNDLDSKIVEISAMVNRVV